MRSRRRTAASRTCHSLQMRKLGEAELTDPGQNANSLRLRQCLLSDKD
ncbi:hypothetical protein KIN_35880 [Litoreibacter roseus]|uniref:Uncharacterized protein n=1 Tax=Litoreibacter roseus TaxID=2601869 RepID=A0A6N6JK52_9RHOB|nr:hypothetical protein KIN_35880 [Litoreibacter roseus]